MEIKHIFAGWVQFEERRNNKAESDVQKLNGINSHEKVIVFQEVSIFIPKDFLKWIIKVSRFPPSDYLLVCLTEDEI